MARENSTNRRRYEPSVLVLAILLAGVACGTEHSEDATAPPSGQASSAATPAQSEVSQTALASLPVEAQRDVARAEMPVLVPNDAAILQRVETQIGPRRYSMTSRSDDLNIVIEGSPVDADTPAHGDQQARDVKQVGHRNVSTTLAEGSRSASWVENGIAYSITVECRDANDQRCESEQFILTLVNSSALVGGRLK